MSPPPATPDTPAKISAEIRRPPAPKKASPAARPEEATKESGIPVPSAVAADVAGPPEGAGPPPGAKQEAIKEEMGASPAADGEPAPGSSPA
jgi:hypothetical protein